MAGPNESWKNFQKLVCGKRDVSSRCKMEAILMKKYVKITNQLFTCKACKFHNSVNLVLMS